MTLPTKTLSPLYCGLVLVLVMLANALSIADRLLIAIVQEPLRAEFQLSDTQLGLLGGTAFALFYSITAVPIARLADRYNRITIITLALGAWSAMTAFCGMAMTYTHLLLARAGVSIGESGGAAPTISYLADVFSAKRVAMAMAVFTLGVPVGTLLATGLGGWIAQTYGWRTAFLAFGALGLLLAVTARLVLREVRVAAPVNAQPRPSLKRTLGALARNRSFVHVCMAGIFATFAGSAIVQYTISFLMRVHDLPLTQASLIVGLTSGIAGTAGLLTGGYASDLIAQRWHSGRTIVCSIAMLIATAAFAGAWWLPLAIAVPLLFVGQFFFQCYPPISYATISAVAPGNMRTTSVAVFTLVCNLIGVGLGPTLVGAISDFAARATYQDMGLQAADCARALGGTPCMTASGYGLQIALTVALIPLLLASFHFWRTTLTFGKDMEGIENAARL